MAKQYKITITDGTGSLSVLNDTYTVTSNTKGYDDSSITPSSVTIVDGTETYDFTISATGSINLIVTEEGSESSTAIVGAKFKRCDKNGNEYGDEITTNSSGIATFINIPFHTDGINLYYKQIQSDGNHNFDNALKTFSVTDNNLTIDIANPRAGVKTFTLKDANYSGLVIESGELNLS